MTTFPRLYTFQSARITFLSTNNYIPFLSVISINDYISTYSYLYLRKCADVERGLEFSCACMALLMASTQPKRSASSLAMKRYSAPLGSLRGEGGREGGREGAEGEGREGGRVGEGRGEGEGEREQEREGRGREGGREGEEAEGERKRGREEGKETGSKRGRVGNKAH